MMARRDGSLVRAVLSTTHRYSTRKTAQCADFLLRLAGVIGCGIRHVMAEQVLAALQHHEVESGGHGRIQVVH